MSVAVAGLASTRRLLNILRDLQGIIVPDQDMLTERLKRHVPVYKTTNNIQCIHSERLESKSCSNAFRHKQSSNEIQKCNLKVKALKMQLKFRPRQLQAEAYVFSMAPALKSCMQTILN